MSLKEQDLEKLFVDELVQQGYEYQSGDKLHREKTEVLLLADLRLFLKNRYGEKGITDSEVESVIRTVKAADSVPYEDNKVFMQKIMNGFALDREDPTQPSLFIELLDYECVDSNIFKIVNQVEIQGPEELRIPDAIIYVNGMPLVVFEFKTPSNENVDILQAYKQLHNRYLRDIPDLFKYNAFVVLSNGIQTKYGSVFAGLDFFYAWKRIEMKDPSAEGIDTMETMVKGLLTKERLLSFIKNFIYFPNKSNDLKVLARYPQYFAATKLFERILAVSKSPQEPGKGKQGGTYFGATGCGKSFTMLFLTRMLMRSAQLENPTIIIITDRTDLDRQLSQTFENSKSFIGESDVVSIGSRKELKDTLSGKLSGGVFLTTIQKFTEDLDLLSSRSNIICISDEAHRSQINLDQKDRVKDGHVERSYGFARYLHDSLPNAVYVGFTGTPIDDTVDVFGEIVDSYTMSDSVKDEITVSLVYEGRAARVRLQQEQLQKIEEYYSNCLKEGASEYQVDQSKKASSTLEVIQGDEDRLRAIAEDFVTHYESRVEDGLSVAGKALFVCANRQIAYRLYQLILELRPDWSVPRKCDVGVKLSENEERKLKEVEKLRLVMTRNKDDEKALYDLLGNANYRKELDRQFKIPNSNFKIAIVVDMWLTGFDVPCLDTMYIDKSIEKHNLIQTISRINRTYPGKTQGLIVDYLGIKSNMNEALNQYTNQQQKEMIDVEEVVTEVKNQLEILSHIFNGFDANPFFGEETRLRFKCLHEAVEFIKQDPEKENRFLNQSRILSRAYQLCAPQYFCDSERNYIHFYKAVRSYLSQLTKGDAPDIQQMNTKVRQMVEDAIQSDGIGLLFHAQREVQLSEILSDQYLDKISSLEYPQIKVNALQQIVKQRIKDFRRFNPVKAVKFTERMTELVDRYNNRNFGEKDVRKVLDTLVDEFTKLAKDIGNDKKHYESKGADYVVAVYQEILISTAKKFKFAYDSQKLSELAKEIKGVVEDTTQYTDWFSRDDTRAQLQVKLIVLMDKYYYPPEVIAGVYEEVLAQAEAMAKVSVASVLED